MRRKRLALAMVVCFIVGGLASAQQTEAESDLAAMIPYSQMKLEIPGLTLEQYNAAVRTVAARRAKRAPSPLVAQDGRFLSNPHVGFGGPILPGNSDNPYGIYGSKYVTFDPAHRHTTRAPNLVNDHR